MGLGVSVNKEKIEEIKNNLEKFPISSLLIKNIEDKGSLLDWLRESYIYHTPENMIDASTAINIIVSWYKTGNYSSFVPEEIYDQFAALFHSIIVFYLENEGDRFSDNDPWDMKKIYIDQDGDLIPLLPDLMDISLSIKQFRANAPRNRAERRARNK